MKLGMPTLLELDNLEAQIDLCKTLGLDFIEINLNIPMNSPQQLSPDYLARLSKQHEIEFTLHLPEELDVASFMEPIRNAATAYICDCLHWANAGGIKMVTMHMNSGIYFTQPMGKVYINEQFYREYVEHLGASMHKIYALSETLGMTLGIENLGNFRLNHISKSLALLSENPEFAVTWDVGHDAKSGFNDTKIIEKYEGSIKHMHLHDYNGKSDHKALFTGQIDLKKYLALAKEKHIGVVIEAKTVESLSVSVKNLTNYLNEEIS